MTEEKRTLRELREAAGLTQLEVAYRLGVTPHTIYMWESGRREPLARVFLRLARLYGVSPFAIALPEEAEAGRRGEGREGKERAAA